MLIQETHFNITEGYKVHETDLYEPFTDNVDELFKSLEKEWGKCVSKIYIDDERGNPRETGGVFQKRMKYEDSSKTYQHETWVTIFPQGE